MRRAVLDDCGRVDQPAGYAPAARGPRCRQKEACFPSKGTGRIPSLARGGSMKIIRFLVVFLALPGVAMAALANAERKSQFERAMASIIAASTPTVFGYVRDTLIKDYVACKPNKGQAVELD